MRPLSPLPSIAAAVVFLCAASLRAQEINFARDIQPILSDKCYHCHGPDANARKAELRFDVLDPKLGPFAERDGYHVVKPGSLDDSVMVMRITSDDADFKMPPPTSNRKLTDKQIDLLKRWVEQGAKWGKHWSFEPPVRPAVPSVKDAAVAARVKNPIDAFLFARMEKE